MISTRLNLVPYNYDMYALRLSKSVMSAIVGYGAFTPYYADLHVESDDIGRKCLLRKISMLGLTRSANLKEGVRVTISSLSSLRIGNGWHGNTRSA